MVYVVYKPANDGKQVIELVTRNKQSAKACAQKLRGLYLAKGWDTWADRVQIKRPRKPELCREIAKNLEHNSETYLPWAKILRACAKELENSTACNPCR